MKILSWNIQQGGGRRVTEIGATVTGLEPDVVVLAEFRNNVRGERLCADLEAAGYTHQVTTSAAPQVNSVLIASQLPGEPITWEAEGVLFHGSLAVLELEALTVFGLYLPHKKKHDLFDLLQCEATRRLETGRRFALVGDFNTGVNGVDQAGNSFWYTRELERLRSAGTIDAFRHLHGDLREFSWWSHGGRGYRYDHSWVSRDLAVAVKRCLYLHEVREVGLSDHSAMWLELSLSS